MDVAASPAVGLAVAKVEPARGTAVAPWLGPPCQRWRSLEAQRGRPQQGRLCPWWSLRDARLPIHRVIPHVVMSSMVRLRLPEEVRGVYTGHSSSVVLLVEMRQNGDA
jgi:hypothetical protein